MALTIRLSEHEELELRSIMENSNIKTASGIIKRMISNWGSLNIQLCKTKQALHFSEMNTNKLRNLMRELNQIEDRKNEIEEAFNLFEEEGYFTEKEILL